MEAMKLWCRLYMFYIQSLLSLRHHHHPPSVVASDAVWASGVQFIQRLNFPSPVMVWSLVLEKLWGTKNFSNILSTDTLFSPLFLKPSTGSTLLGGAGASVSPFIERSEWVNKKYLWNKRESGAGTYGSRGSWRSGEREMSQKTLEGWGIVLRTAAAADGVHHGARAKCLERWCWKGSLFKVCPRTRVRHEHALGLHSRVLSNYKPSVLPRLIFSGWYTQWERTNRKSLEISKNSCYFGEQFCYMRLYLAPGLPNHFEDISEHLTVFHSVSKLYITSLTKSMTSSKEIRMSYSFL